MPLKAKITSPGFSGQAAKMSSTSTHPTEEPGDDPDDVLFNTIYGVRTIELNRPEKLNSLNGSMARKIISRLKEWENSQLANIVIIGGAGPRAFCAGGDVAALARQNTSGATGQAASKAYFALEYRLDHLIATYPKPYVAYLDGITMGGGVGLGVHAPFRIATERTLFAMPETTIGLFPDVGGSFFLPRLEGSIGTYLALTSERLKGVNAFWAGIATHYIDSSSLSRLTERLSELQFRDYEPLASRLAIIDATIEEFGTGFPHNEPMLLAGETRMAVDRCFRHNTVEKIMEALKSEKGPMKDWAQKTMKTIREKSPTSVKVALRQMRLGKNWSIGETFQREYHLAGKFMEHPDFVNGVTARLMTKPPTMPAWNPPTLEDVTDKHVDDMFSVEGEGRLKLLGEGDYGEYPFTKTIGLPREEEVERIVRARAVRKEEVVSLMVAKRFRKPGVTEKVTEILERRCNVVDRHLVWKE